MKRYIRIVLIPVILICILALSACEHSKPALAYRAGQINDSVKNCIEYKKTEELKEVFCEKLLDNYNNLDEDIERFYEFVEGDIVSFGKTMYGELGSKRDGEYTQYSFSHHIRKVISSTGKEYRMIIYSISVWKDEPERVGVSEIDIIDEETDKECSIGDYYIVNPESKR